MKRNDSKAISRIKKVYKSYKNWYVHKLGLITFNLNLSNAKRCESITEFIDNAKYAKLLKNTTVPHRNKAGKIEQHYKNRKDRRNAKKQIRKEIKEFDIMTFKEAINMPLHLDKHYCYMWSRTGEMVFSCLDYENDDLLQRVLNKLNEESDEIFNAEYKDEIIYIDGKELLLIRGWGHFTSPSGLNLKPEEAAKIQDDFCEWCVEVLNN